MKNIRVRYSFLLGGSQTDDVSGQNKHSQQGMPSTPRRRRVAYKAGTALQNKSSLTIVQRTSSRANDAASGFRV
eukprot:31160-Pelagococcus_subviridis.AAC.10